MGQNRNASIQRGQGESFANDDQATQGNRQAPLCDGQNRGGKVQRRWIAEQYLAALLRSSGGHHVL
jgi:hypothetical protein